MTVKSELSNKLYLSQYEADPEEWYGTLGSDS